MAREKVESAEGGVIALSILGPRSSIDKRDTNTRVVMMQVG